jgi:hypothetical protein
LLSLPVDQEHIHSLADFPIDGSADALPESLPLPMIAALGFFEVLILMWVMVWLANRYDRKQQALKHTQPVYMGSS